MSTIIYHNPNCTTSRNVLALLQERGLKPQIIEYLKTPPSRARLSELLAQMGKKPRDILRKNGTPYAELGLDDLSLSDEKILDAIEAHPILIERPIVVTQQGARLCRPKETVFELIGA
ncbi:MAG: arsenate reductase (glutaredoxin) [Alphaproteobacteria bacterium]|nr:arsenate reductase (glutaredoxin) [Alphaproteobacteria bacterium]